MLFSWLTLLLYLYLPTNKCFTVYGCSITVLVLLLFELQEIMNFGLWTALDIVNFALMGSVLCFYFFLTSRNQSKYGNQSGSSNHQWISYTSQSFIVLRVYGKVCVYCLVTDYSFLLCLVTTEFWSIFVLMFYTLDVSTFTVSFLSIWLLVGLRTVELVGHMSTYHAKIWQTLQRKYDNIYKWTKG